MLWHPLYRDVLAVGDFAGDINYYDMRFSNAGFGFDGLFEDEFASTF